jgi:hypothetical protein
MSTTTTTATTTYGLQYWVAQTLHTRRYGSTYVHAGARRQASFSWEALRVTFENREIVFSFTGWGRSLLSRGHKYKAHARYADTGTPVPSKVLRDM